MTGLGTLDWVLLAVALLSTLWGLWRGFMREVLSLAGWVLAVVLAVLYAKPLGHWLPFLRDWPDGRTAVAAVLILVCTVFATALAAALVHTLLAKAKLSGADRVLGGLFGFARALLVVAVAVALLAGTGLAQEAWWRESKLVPWVQAGVAFALPWLPPSWRGT
ncbi:MAG: CvpA family protein [Betaproteobacteria bacterium]